MKKVSTVAAKLSRNFSQQKLTIDPELLGPVKHRSAKAQADLTVIRARAGLVRARTALVNTAPRPGQELRRAAARM